MLSIKMNLAVFDIDGTLTKTNGVDGRCFAAAFAQELDLPELSTDWSGYEHRTDSGIADEIFRRHMGIPPTEGQIDAVKRRFLSLLEEAYRENPGEFEPVQGARVFLESLVSDSWHVALATGGWRHSAQFKLAAAGLDMDLPMATGDDAVSRESIVTLAVEKAARHYTAPSFERIVSLGDGEWDAKTARNLGLCFVGISAESDRQELRGAGANRVIGNYLDVAECLEAIGEAGVPKLHLL